jgi:hypothetical protein
LDFCKLKVAVSRQFDKMNKHDLFVTQVAKDSMWETYLDSFPVGSNPMFRERTEHNCSCCRQFIRTIGNVVAIIDGRIESIWDTTVAEPAYQVVVDSMAALVRSQPIHTPFLHYEKTVGTDKNFEDDGGKVKTWDHFFVDIPYARNRGKNYYAPKKDIPTLLGEARSNHDVFLRALKELSAESLDTTLELIAQNSLYRGQEHKATVDKFLKIKKEFDKLGTPAEEDIFVWSRLDSVPMSVSKVRSTSIGTLLVDLSEGLDLEDAVRKFEAVMAPANYKRPTALVTKAMVDAAKQKIEDLGLTSALDRRYAHLTDLNVNNIIFADRQAKKAMKGDVFDSITTKVVSPKNLSKIETVPIDKFVSDVVPNVDSIEVMFENRYVNNLVSLVAPVDAKALPLFKWDNGFSWSYNGDMTDSIKERVKQAGGNVTGDLCCRLAWFNHDDLDFHMKEPGGFEIFFRAKQSPYTKGCLDVDMNAGGGHTREPVENIFYGDRNRMNEGIYTLFVHNWAKRETTNVGFEVEVDYLGAVTKYAYENSVKNGEIVVVSKFKYSHNGGLEVLESLASSVISKKLWGLDTQNFHRVNVLTLSPNYWDERGTGNKHYFFMLDGCVNDGQARGFFNEFLRSDLDKHRKVIEIVGSKMKTEESVNQLSGLGFSETKRNEVLVRVKGNFTRTLKVQI